MSNSNPAATDPDNGDVWVQEGPHLMVVVPKEMLAGLSGDPESGGPYVMWKDTPTLILWFLCGNSSGHAGLGTAMQGV